MAGGTMAPKSVIGWKEAQVDPADLDLLRPGNWLNDHLITFYMEYLSRRYKNSHKKHVYVSAEVSSWLGLYADEEDVEDTIRNLGVYDADLAFFPVNNSSSRLQESGTHWSLLLRIKRGRNKPKDDDEWCFCGVPIDSAFSASAPDPPRRVEWLYFDSMGSLNWHAAVRLAQKMTPSHPEQISMEKVPCAQQHNSADCGMYTIIFAEQFSEHGMVPTSITEEQVNAKRERTRELILSLRDS